MRKLFFVFALVFVGLIMATPMISEEPANAVLVSAGRDSSLHIPVIPAGERIRTLEKTMDSIATLVAIDFAVTALMLLVLCVTLATSPAFIHLLGGGKPLMYGSAAQKTTDKRNPKKGEVPVSSVRSPGIQKKASSSATATKKKRTVKKSAGATVMPPGTQEPVTK